MKCLIASIHFMPVSAVRAYTGRIYSMPAVPLGATPQLLETEDLIQHDSGPVSSGPGGGRRQKLEHPVMGEEIAACLVREWSMTALGCTPDCHPGIWVVRTKIPLMTTDPTTGAEVADLDVFRHQRFRDATPEERAAMWEEDVATNKAADLAYANECFLLGKRISEDFRTAHLIPRLLKQAALHYSMDAPWAKQGANSLTMSCPHCGKPTSRTHFICASCQQPTDMEKWAQFMAKKNAALAAVEQQPVASGKSHRT